MQGVFIVRTITGWDELEKTVKSHNGFVFVEEDEPTKAGSFLQQDKKYVKLMTEAQKKKYLQAERLRNSIMGGGFQLEWPQPEHILVLETLKSNLYNSAAGSREWLVDRFNCAIRPKSKKELAEQVKADPSQVHLEATSVFGNEYGGPLTHAPRGSFSVVGPDPAKKRSWYAQISWSESKGWVVQ